MKVLKQVGTLLSLGLLFLGWMPTAYAASSDPYFPEINQRAFGLGANSQHISYRELLSDQTTVLDREDGSLPGGHLSFTLPVTHIGGHPIVFSLGADYATGTLDYRGSTWGGETLNVLGKHRMYDYEAGLTYLARRNPNWALTYGASLGYHYFHGGGGIDAATRPGDYGEVYQHYQWSIGGAWHYAMTSRIHAASEIRFGSTFSAQMAAEDMGSEQAPLSSLGNEPAFVFKEDLSWRMSSEWTLHAFIQYTAFAYGRSAASSLGIYEPDSTTSIANYGLAVTYNLNA